MAKAEFLASPPCLFKTVVKVQRDLYAKFLSWPSIHFLILTYVFWFCFLSGISSEVILRPEDISQEELLDMMVKLNKDSTVSGILVQLPLPGRWHLLSYLSYTVNVRGESLTILHCKCIVMTQEALERWHA